ncbi:hypothetical protein Bca4012_060568 [Brassica carinata]
MMNNRVGYRFSPTNEELINFYLKNKILGLVDDSISEVDIYSFDPKLLPPLSKIYSNDRVWYFFYPNESTKQRRRRSTPTGFWKPTGQDRTIQDKGGKGYVIGILKTLVYHEGKSPHGVWTPWVMHEYHITCLPPSQRTYVICKIIYKGEDFRSGGSEVGIIPSGGNEVGNVSTGGNEVGNFSSAGSVVGNFPSCGNISSDLCHSSVSDLNSTRATTVTELDKHQQCLPSVQRLVDDTVRAANFAKMYKLLQNLPSVEIQGKLNSNAAP